MGEPWLRYRKRPMEVEARGPLLGQEAVRSLHGIVLAQKGDYICRGPKDEWPIDAEEFHRSYELVEDGAS